MSQLARVTAQGGLEGLQPSKNLSFLVVMIGFAYHYHQKMIISGRQNLPEPLHRVSSVNDTTYAVAHAGGLCDGSRRLQPGGFWN